LDFYFEIGLHNLVHDYRHGGISCSPSNVVVFCLCPG
jgi:hypothetical protein